MSETFAQAVERLKRNENHIIFMNMAEKDQDILNQIPQDQLEYLTGDKELQWSHRHGPWKPCVSCIYRIRPDYQLDPPKPKYIDQEVFVNLADDLMVDRPDGVRGFIESVVHQRNFRGFYSNSIDERNCFNVWNSTESIAGTIRNGFTVIARFERM